MNKLWHFEMVWNNVSLQGARGVFEVLVYGLIDNLDDDVKLN